MKYPIYICLILLIISCSPEESNPLDETDLYGNWQLISAETNRKIDYNGDGNISNDITEDLDCFNIELYLHEDSTFEEILIDKNNEGDLNCAISKNRGEWILNDNNEIVFNYFDDSNAIIKKIENSINIINSGLFEIKRKFTDEDGGFSSSLRFSLIRG